MKLITLFKSVFVFLISNCFRNETEELKRKLENLEKKILVGGENLLEKVETQEQLLELAAKELDERKTREDHLNEQIKQKEVGIFVLIEKIDLFSSL